MSSGGSVIRRRRRVGRSAKRTSSGCAGSPRRAGSRWSGSRRGSARSCLVHQDARPGPHARPDRPTSRAPRRVQLERAPARHRDGARRRGCSGQPGAGRGRPGVPPRLGGAGAGVLPDAARRPERRRWRCWQNQASRDQPGDDDEPDPDPPPQDENHDGRARSAYSVRAPVALLTDRRACATESTVLRWRKR